MLWKYINHQTTLFSRHKKAYSPPEIQFDGKYHTKPTYQSLPSVVTRDPPVRDGVRGLSHSPRPVHHLCEHLDQSWPVTRGEIFIKQQRWTI